MKRIMLVVLFFVAAPFWVSAAMDKFPVTPEEILEHQLQNLDVCTVDAYIDRHPIYNSPFFKVDSAKRSRAEVEALLSAIIREVVRVNVNLEDPLLEGKSLFVSWTLWKDVRKLGQIIFDINGGWWNETTLTRGPDGKIMIPETVFTVDLLAHVLSSSGVGIFVPNILRAELTVEDENGNVLETRTTEDADFFSPGVFFRSDMLSIATVHLTEQRRGKLKLWYRGGTEQTFDRMTGKLLETVLPDLRPISVTRYGEKSIMLSISNVEGKTLAIDTASNLPRWEALPAASLAKVTRTSNGDLTLILPLEGPRQFFQARVVPSSIRIQ